MKPRVFVFAVFLLGLVMGHLAHSVSGRVQILWKWDDTGWNRVIVKLKDGSEVAYQRSQLWGLFYDYGTANVNAPPSTSTGSSTWKLHLPSTLEGSFTLNGKKGIFRYDNGDEPVDVRISNGQISFVRVLTGGRQVYQGRFVSADRVEGTFDCTLTGSGQRWYMTRIR